MSYLRGRKTDLPPFVVLPEIMGRGGGNLPNGQAGGFLGKAHDPFRLDGRPLQTKFSSPQPAARQRHDWRGPTRRAAAACEKSSMARSTISKNSDDARLLDENFPFRLPA